MSSDTRSAGQRGRRRAFFWLSAGSWGLSAVAHAGGAGPAPVDSDLEQVVVTGRLEEDLPIDLEKYGTRGATDSAEQIRNGGYLDLAQTLQALTPGLYSLLRKTVPSITANISPSWDRARKTFSGSSTESESTTVFMGARLRSIPSPPRWSSAS